MPDVGSQLAEYFEAAVERIDAEDVMAQARVSEQLRPAPRRTRPTWAAVAGFVGVLLLVGGALAAGWLLHDPGLFEPGPVATPTAEPGVALAWWPLVLAAAAIVIGAAAVFIRLRRARKEVEMQTLEKKPQEATDTRVHTLARRSRWLVVALALVLVVGAVAIGWLIAENRSLSSDLDARVWPAESELTGQEQYMLEVVEDYQLAWDNGDLDTLMGLYTPTATHEMAGASSSNEDGRLRATLESWQSLGASTTFGPGLGEKVSTVVLGNDVFLISASPSMGLFIYRFSFASGEEPLIEKSEMIGMAP